MKIFKLFLFIFFLSITHSCEEIIESPTEGSYTNDLTIDKEDESGNLVIDNQTNFRLLLYVDGVLTKLIPANTEYFRVSVITTGLKSFNLTLYKKTDIIDEELQVPPSSKIYKQWQVIIPPKESSDYIEWQVIDNEDVFNKSVVYFNYPKKNPDASNNLYNVDIYLNNKSGNEIASIQPGSTSELDFEFGYHVLYFRYWKSNSNTSTEEEELGWVEQKPNGQNYSLVLNSYNKEINFYIPTYFELFASEIANLTIRNNSDQVVFVFANGQPIENFIVTENDEPTTGLSYIDANKEVIYKVPIEYIFFKVIIPSTNQTIFETDFDIANKNILTIN